MRTAPGRNLLDLRRQPVRFPGQPIPNGLGPEMVQPSQPGALGPEQGVYVRLPGANYAPAGATPVYEIGDGNVAVSATAIVVTYTVPDTVRCRITHVGFGADDETALGYLNWSIRFGLDSQPGYINKPAALGTLLQPFPVTLYAGSSVTINLAVTASANAVITYRYIAVLLGYLWREDVA